jgi:hypothetical protein
MKTKSFLLLTFALPMMIFCSCKKESDSSSSPSSSSGTYSGISDFFNKNGAAFQNFTVNGTSGGTFTASKGTIFTFPVAAFVNMNDQPVTGTVNIKVKEFYENKDMLLSRVTTTSNGYPLISGGMFDVEATAEGAPVKFAPGKNLLAELPADSTDNLMMAFFGAPDSANNVNWQPADTGGTGAYVTPTSQSYLFSTDSIGYCNVDRFYSAPADIHITVNTLNNPNSDSTYVCVWFTGYKAVWPLYATGTQFQFESNHVKPVPVSLIAITVLGGKIYAAIVSLPTLTANQTYDLSMSEMTDAAFKSAIESLE